MEESTDTCVPMSTGKGPAPLMVGKHVTVPAGARAGLPAENSAMLNDPMQPTGLEGEEGVRSGSLTW